MLSFFPEPLLSRYSDSSSVVELLSLSPLLPLGAYPMSPLALLRTAAKIDTQAYLVNN